MISTPKEYFEYLYTVQQSNPPSLAVLPTSETTYDIDLNTRQVVAPEYLSVEKDHKSETIYFLIDRYFDYMDLAETTCVVQYTNGAGKSYIYTVPFFDVTTHSDKGKMLFPWCIDGAATEAAGPVQYSIQFFKLDSTGTKFAYNLNTLSATSKVLHGMNVEELNQDYDIEPTLYKQLLAEITTVGNRYVYWDDI